MILFLHALSFKKKLAFLDQLHLYIINIPHTKKTQLCSEIFCTPPKALIHACFSFIAYNPYKIKLL